MMFSVRVSVVHLCNVMIVLLEKVIEMIESKLNLIILSYCQWTASTKRNDFSKFLYLAGDGGRQDLSVFVEPVALLNSHTV